MHAIILDAGFGTRFDPKWGTTDKAFLRIKGRPAIDWIVDCLRVADVATIHIIHNGENANRFKRWRKSISTQDRIISKIKFQNTRVRVPQDSYGAVKTLWFAAGFLQSPDAVVVLCCDNIITFQLMDFISSIDMDSAAICVQKMQPGDELNEYGKVDLSEDGRVLGLYEKKSVGLDSVWLGPAYFPAGWTADLCEFILEMESTNQPTDNLGDFLSYYAQRKKLIGWLPAEGKVFDIGTRRKYDEATTEISTS